MRELATAGRPPAGGAAEAWWEEHLRTADLSVGTYVVPAGGADPQVPHTEDEIYFVVSGRGVLTGPEGEIAARPGSVLFVGAGEEHRFERVEEDLVAVVVFGPAEGSRE
jgi:mannose-6-phosphate isomerase-like protein (cupin superfamily)